VERVSIVWRGRVADQGEPVDEIPDVGLDLVAQLQEAVNDKVYKAIALRIRTKVDAARSDPDTSSRRWPFELIQNAHDASARAGREGISLTFDFTNGVLRFEHDAAPFTMDEFAALLTGGSSKDFMSTETTGRFGTGFLVTHVVCTENPKSDHSGDEVRPRRRVN
jgi:hypothetical protein